MLQFDTGNAILIVSGESPSVLELADGELDAEVRQRNPIGSSKRNGEPSTENSVVVQLPLNTDSDDAALASAEIWLKRNRAVLIELDARKTLEFQNYLKSEFGSCILTIPNSLIQIAAELRLNIANQTIRLLTEDECSKLKQ